MKSNIIPNHFETAGIYVEGQRSDFNFNKPHRASFMAGMLVPMGDPIPVFPGVKLDLEADAGIRSATMVVPPLDSMLFDVITVWIPHRIVWIHFPQFCGENEVTAWTQTNSYVYPSIPLGSCNDTLNSGLGTHALDKSVAAANNFLMPHYGLFYGNNLGSSPASTLRISTLAMRGYYFLWNYLVRDENYQRPVLFDKGDNGSTGEFGYSLINYNLNTSKYLSDVTTKAVGVGVGYSTPILMPVNKFHDAFTSGLPQPQFGDPVNLIDANNSNIYMHMDSGLTVGSDYLFGIKNTNAGAHDQLIGTLSNSSALYDTSGNKVVDAYVYNQISTTINQFRTSVMYQRYLEALARGGRRVPEYYQVIYGVKNTAAAKDYPLLLNRSRYKLGVNQVVATADAGGTGWSTHLGDTGAFSYTVLQNIPICEQDFTEFGYLHILYCVRSELVYSTMIQPHFLRSELLDEYNPFFDHIGDVGVANTTVNALATTAGNFFYQEAWWDERTQLGLAVGALNKKYGSLKYWTIGEEFDSSLVTCTPSYLVFNPALYNDVFVSNYYTYPQFIGQFRIRGKKIARMSAHSIPGIVGRI